MRIACGIGLLCALASCKTTNNGNPPVDGLLTPQAALQACVSSDACRVKPYGFTSLCRDHWTQQLRIGTAPVWDAIYRCVNAAQGDCAAVRACYGMGTEPAGCTQVSEGFCDGNVAVECDTLDRKLYRFDCAQAGLVCGLSEVATGTFAPVCTPRTCDPTTDPIVCEGDRKLTCGTGVIAVLDCAADGLVCRDDGSGGVCSGDLGPCDEQTFVPRCDAEILAICREGRITSIDCAAQPGDRTCDAVSGICGPAGTACSPIEESCTGSQMSLCIDGSRVAIDCPALGFSQCEVVGGGAHCRP